MSLHIEFSETGFKVFFKDLLIASHSKTAPWIVLGKGIGSFNIRAAHARIQDQVTQRSKLGEYTILWQNEDNVIIRLSEKTPDEPIVIDIHLQVAEGRLEITLQCQESSINRCWVKIPAKKDEAIFGCGEQHSELNLRGWRVPLWVEELGVGRRGLIAKLLNQVGNWGGHWYSTYFPQPTFVSTAHYFCHVDTTVYAEFDFTKADNHELYFWGVPEKLVFDAGESLVDVVTSLSAYLGRQPVLPDWVRDGAWVAIQGGTQVVEEKVQRALDAGVKIGAVWSQEWCGARKESVHTRVMWNWCYDEDLYAGLPDLIQQLASKGIRYLGYINSFFILGQPLCIEAEQNGYLVKNQAGETYLLQGGVKMPLVDLSNPEAYAWLKEIIKNNMLGIGLSGWMADFGEYVPTDGVLFSGESPETYHNKYPVIWAKLNYEALEEAGKLGDVVFFTRAGYSGVSRYTTLVWVGDQLVNWHRDNGFPSAICACLSVGFSGIGLVHSDTGGYSMMPHLIHRTKELFMRWAEHGAFTVTLRTHEGNCPPISWQFDSDEETLTHFAKMSRIYVHLKPYSLAVLDEYYSTGLPTIRHPILHYEGDHTLFNMKTEYLYGRDLLVAPVLKPKKTSWKVYLPEDEWIHVWTSRRYGKGWHVVPAPLGQLPVFYRASSTFADLFQGIKNL